MRRHLACAITAICLLLTSCTASPVPVQPYLDDLEEVLTLRAEISASYTSALKTVLEYTRAPSSETLAKARTTCVSALEEIVGVKIIESALTDEQRTAMAELGMDQADYSTPFLMQEYEKTIRLQDLSDLLGCLNEDPPFDDLAASLAEDKLFFERCDWQIEVAAVNILLADIPEERLGAFRDTFLPELAALSGEALSWETDRDVLEARAGAVFGRMEASIELTARETGELYLEMLSRQQDLQQELEAAGVDPERAEQLAGQVKRLEEESG